MKPPLVRAGRRPPRARCRSVLGIEPTAIRQCEPSTVRPSSSVTTTPSPVALTGTGPGLGQDLHAAAPEDVLEHAAASASSPGSTRSRRGHQRRPARRARCRRDANSAPVTPEPDDDQVLGQPLERVDLLPGEDPLAVGHRVGQHPRVRAGRDQHGVGVERLLAAVVERRHDAGGPSSRPTPRSTVTPSRLEPGRDVGGLGLRQRGDPGVHLSPGRRPTRVGRLLARSSADPEPDAELAGLRRVASSPRRCDQGLARARSR